MAKRHEAYRKNAKQIANMLDGKPLDLTKDEIEELEQAEIDKLRALYPNGHPRFLQMLMDEAKLHNDKNHDYASGGSVFGNFERVAAILQLYPGFPYDTREGVNVIYMLKQLDCILWGMCKKIEHKVEGSGQRAGDVSVYVKLLRLMLEEPEQAA